MKIKSPDQIKEMRKLGRLTASIMKSLIRFTRPGLSTRDIEDKAGTLIEKSGVKPAFLGYRGYPASICASVNEELIHGIPAEDKILQKADIVSIDFGLYNGRFYSDMTKSFSLGNPSELARRLLKVGRSALRNAIKAVRPDGYLGDIGWTIQNIVESAGFAVVKKFVGHGIGEFLHEEPEIPNFGERSEGVRLKEGMVLAIEPMVTVDSPAVDIRDDGWTVVSRDRKPCVHFEHTVAVAKKGAWVLTQ